MKATELRIGNWVEDHSEDGGIVQVKEIGHLLDKKLISIGFIIPSGGYSQTSLEEGDGFDELEEDKMIQPIPLTEEWLVKFGFEEYSKHINGDFELCIKSDKPSQHIVVRVYRGGFSVFNHSECDFTQIQFINRVKHVHQLQNLYFALTGEELTIK
jgi:hypothetical protein